MNEPSKVMRIWIAISVAAIGWSWFLASNRYTSDPGDLVIIFGPGAIAIIGWAIWWISKGK